MKWNPIEKYGIWQILQIKFIPNAKVDHDYGTELLSLPVFHCFFFFKYQFILWSKQHVNKYMKNHIHTYTHLCLSLRFKKKWFVNVLILQRTMRASGTSVARNRLASASLVSRKMQEPTTTQTSQLTLARASTEERLNQFVRNFLRYKQKEK